MSSPTPQEIFDLIDKVTKFLPLNVTLNVTLGPPSDVDPGFVGSGLASTDRPEPAKLLEMARGRVAFLEKQVEHLLFLDKVATEAVAAWKREYENMKRLMTVAEERVLVLEGKVPRPGVLVERQSNTITDLRERLAKAEIALEFEKHACEQAKAQNDRHCNSLLRIKDTLTNVPHAALVDVVGRAYRLAQDALEGVVSTSNVEQMNVKLALEKLLNSCWCDDGGQLPECRVCVELRKIWKGL